MVKRSHFITYLWRSMTWDDETLKPQHSSIESLCRHFEAGLAKDISPILEAYSLGQLSASELLIELNSLDGNYERIHEV